MAFENLHDVLVDNLKDLLHAEKQLVKALPKLARSASSPDLREALEEHLEVTKNQVTRLEEVFSSIGEPAKTKKCLGMEGLVAEGEEALEDKKESAPAALDAAIIVAAQKIEHYEISAYGSVRAFANILGYEPAAQLLQQTLDEESEADEKLTHLAEKINASAASEGSEEEEAVEVEARTGTTGSRSRNSRSRATARSR